MKTKYIIIAAALVCSTVSFAQQKNKFQNQLKHKPFFFFKETNYFSCRRMVLN